MKILVLCTGNSCRSQMAEGFLKKYLGNKGLVYSAGVEAHGMNPYAMQVMDEAGCSIRNQVSEKMDKYLHVEFDYVITVCDNAKEHCPYFPGNVKRVHQSFNDPANAKGTEEEKLIIYRKVRDEIDVYCKNFIKEALGE